MSQAITAILVDDEQDSLFTIVEQVKIYCPEVEIIGAYDDAEEGLENILKRQPDVAFLDVQMPKLSGLEIARRITPHGINVVFITAHNKYAVDAFRLSAIDYLLKPLQDPEELIEAVRKVGTNKSIQQQGPVLGRLLDNEQAQTFSQDTEIALADDKHIHFFNINEIIRLEAQKNCCHFYFTNGRDLLVTKNLGTYIKSLTKYGLRQANRSEVVNLKQKQKVIKKGPYLVMNDDVKVQITPTYRVNFPFL